MEEGNGSEKYPGSMVHDICICGLKTPEPSGAVVRKQRGTCCGTHCTLGMLGARGLEPIFFVALGARG